jgi:septal ring factor EnvC (AmiA/AmiB activator)
VVARVDESSMNRIRRSSKKAVKASTKERQRLEDLLEQTNNELSREIVKRSALAAAVAAKNEEIRDLQERIVSLQRKVSAKRQKVEASKQRIKGLVELLEQQERRRRKEEEESSSSS